MPDTDKSVSALATNGHVLNKSARWSLGITQQCPHLLYLVNILLRWKNMRTTIRYMRFHNVRVAFTRKNQMAENFDPNLIAVWNSLTLWQTVLQWSLEIMLTTYECYWNIVVEILIQENILPIFLRNWSKQIIQRNKYESNDMPYHHLSDDSKLSTYVHRAFAISGIEFGPIFIRLSKRFRTLYRHL